MNKTISAISSASRKNLAQQAEARMSSRQIECWRLIALGFTEDAMKKRMGIGNSTLRHLRSDVYSELRLEEDFIQDSSRRVLAALLYWLSSEERQHEIRDILTRAELL